MATGPQRHYMARTEAQAAELDLGLRAYMQKVFSYMGGGLALTGLVAFGVAQSPAILATVLPLWWVFALATVGIAFYFGFRIHAMSAGTAQALFWVFATLMGLSLTSIFIVYTGTSIARTFFITAGTFAAMALYGYTTKRDLTSMGSFLIMGVIGLIIASIVNLFIASTALHWAISVLGVLIFTGLTAYDTQKIKEMYWEGDDQGTATKKAVSGALNLYLDFINLFLYMLRFVGENR